MQKLYEAMYIVRPDLADEELRAVMQRAADTITQVGATVDLNEIWDRRELAYEINDFTRGTYCLMYFQSEGAAVETLRRELELDEQVLRATIFVPNPDAIWKPKPPEEPKEEAAEEAPAEAGVESGQPKEQAAAPEAATPEQATEAPAAPAEQAAAPGAATPEQATEAPAAPTEQAADEQKTDEGGATTE